MVDTDLVDHNQIIRVDLFSKKTLRQVFLTSSGLVLLSFCFGNFLRFATNVILTRLLVPADFGIMQLVLVFLAGCQMFIDLGVGVNIIQSRRGGDLDFLRTAWTVQVIRSFLIWFALLLIAWPAGYIYDAPILMYLIPLAGLGIIFDGFSSTNLPLLNKHMEFRKLVVFEIFTSFIGAGVLIVLVLIFRSVWALAVSMVITSFIKCCLSHLRTFGSPMGFLLEGSAFKEIIHFGKWIFLSSMGGFLFSKIDKIILGLYLSKSELGLYGIATAFPMIILDLTRSMNSKILLPLYAYFVHHKSGDLRKKTFKLRASVLCLSLPPLYLMSVWGDKVVDFLYPEAYRGAGWILRVMAAGYTLRVIALTVEPILVSAGDTFRSMLLMIFTALLILLAMGFGGFYYGITGMIVAVAFSELYVYPLLVFLIKKYGVWLPFLDLAAAMISFIVIGLGLYFFRY